MKQFFYKKNNNIIILSLIVVIILMLLKEYYSNNLLIENLSDNNDSKDSNDANDCDKHITQTVSGKTDQQNTAFNKILNIKNKSKTLSCTQNKSNDEIISAMKKHNNK